LAAFAWKTTAVNAHASRRGELIVFHPPTRPNDTFIKRLIGVPGDIVLIKQAQVFVNGQLLDEPYVRFPARYAYHSTGSRDVCLTTIISCSATIDRSAQIHI
jgi:signal peptidase I